jgi:O-antigen ligase
MRQILLVGLFAILLGDIMLGLGLTLGPGLSLKNALLYVLFIMLVLEFAIGRRDALREMWPLHTAWLLLAIYATFTWLVIILLGVHRGYDAFGNFIALKGRLFDLILFLLVYLYGPKDTAKTLNLLRWLIAIFVLVNVVTVIDVFNIPDLGIMQDRSDGRLAGPVKEVNQYGGVLIFIIPITAGLALSSSGWLRTLFAAGSLLAFVLLGLTVSRGSYLGLAVGGTFALYLARDHVRRESIVRGGIAILVVVAIAGAAIVYQNPEGFLAKFEVSGSSMDTVSSGRLDFWRQSLTMMSYWPFSFVTGYGWNAYATLFLGYGDPHNTYLLYWFNLGLVGLGLYLFLVVWIIRFTAKSLRLMPENVKPIIIGFLIGFSALHVALFFVAIYTPWLFIWAIAGCVFRLIVDYRRQDSIQANDVTSVE